MRLVIADTGPLNYLVLTGDIELLPKLFEVILIPQSVRAELADSGTPRAVRTWIENPPPWLDVRPDPEHVPLEGSRQLDRREQAAIALALGLHADLVLMDEREGVAIARREGLAVTGTIGILDLAARRGLVDLAKAFARLKATGFYYRQGLLDSLLAKYTDKHDPYAAQQV